MSDVSQGPGWWQASDGRWYAPELHPHHVPPPPPPSATPPPPPTTSGPPPPGWAQPAAGPLPPDPGLSAPQPGSRRPLGPAKLLPGIVIGAGVLVVLGSLLPWATVSSGIGSLSVDGTSGDGKLTLILGVIALVMGVVLLQRGAGVGWLVGTGVVFLVTLGVSIKDASDISSFGDQVTALVGVHVGFGLWLCILGSIAGVVATALLLVQRRAAGRSQPLAATTSPGAPPSGGALTAQPQPSPGPGWWQATDGQWYPPEAHPGAQGPTPPPAPPLG